MRRESVSLVLSYDFVYFPVLKTDAIWLIFVLLIVELCGWIGPVAGKIVWHIDAGLVSLAGGFANVADVPVDDVNMFAWFFRFLLHLI